MGARVLVRCRLGTVLVPMGCPVLSPGSSGGMRAGRCALLMALLLPQDAGFKWMAPSESPEEHR